MVVVWHPAYGVRWHPHNDPLAPDLDEELNDVPGKIRDLTTLQDILASRTLYGSEKVGLLVKLRRFARETLEDGITWLKDVCKQIEETEVLAGEKVFEVHMALPCSLLSPFALTLGQEFKASKEARQAIKDHVDIILHTLNIQPQTNTLRELLYELPYEDVVAPIAEIRDDLDQESAEPKPDRFDSTYWQTLRQIASHDDGSANSLKRLHQLLQNWVVPDLQFTLELSEKV